MDAWRGPGRELLLARCRHLVAAGPSGDPFLVGDLTRRIAAEPDDAALSGALGLAQLAYASSRGEGTTAPLRSAVEAFRRALDQDSGELAARTNLVEALALLGEKEAAAQAARTALVLLERGREEGLLAEGAGCFGVALALRVGSFGSGPMARVDGATGVASAVAVGSGLNEFACVWERAGVGHAGSRAGEARAKKALLAWRLHQLLAELTGAASH